MLQIGPHCNPYFCFKNVISKLRFCQRSEMVCAGPSSTLMLHAIRWNHRIIAHSACSLILKYISLLICASSFNESPQAATSPLYTTLCASCSEANVTHNFVCNRPGLTQYSALVGPHLKCHPPPPSKKNKRSLKNSGAPSDQWQKLAFPFTR